MVDVAAVDAADGEDGEEASTKTTADEEDECDVDMAIIVDVRNSAPTTYDDGGGCDTIVSILLYRSGDIFSGWERGEGRSK